MPLDPDIVALGSDDGPPLSSLTLAEARAITRGVVALQGEAVPVASVRDVVAGTVPIRLYRPAGAASSVLVWAHAGGWIRGDLDTWDIPLRDLAVRAGCVVASVGYRLAPEARWPAALEDVLTAVRYVLASGYERVAVGGDSAGGTLATAAALALRDLGDASVAAQVLLYPPTDPFYGSPAFVRYADGSPLSTQDIRERDDLGWLWNQYLPSVHAADHPYAAPARARSLAGSPPAIVATAEYDILRDDAESYAARLAADGVPVVVRRFSGMVHSFFHFGGKVPAARALADWVAEELRPLLA